MILRRAFLFLLTLILPYAGWTQGLQVIGIPRQQPKAHTKPAARTQALTLPFWDDFSDTSTGYANTDRWLYGRSVLVNDGMAINPPSIGVATFDGLDSLGKPYNSTDILAKGYADKLVSAAIDLTTVAPADRDSVYLSFYYEMRGNGEEPDEGDRLLLSFLDSLGEWVPIDTIDNDGAIEPDIFYTAISPIADPRFYHSEFKFMIKNFGRLSGPYDAWHVDYFYLNKGRTATDTSFPDRAITTEMTSLLGVYRKVPVDHFLLAKDSILTHPSVVITNLRSDQVAPGGQPMTVVTTAHVTYRDNKAIVNEPQFGPHINTRGPDIPYHEFLTYTSDSIPDLNLPGTVDSLVIEVAIGANTKDNVLPVNDGDYDTRKYAPIDFRVNDTTKTTFILTNEYAYDDGTAEYGAGVNQPGSQVAYEYDLVGVEQENVTFLEMYFPRFGDESSQVIELRIWNDLKTDPVYTEVTSLVRSEQNKFWLKQLTQPVPVKKKFYIGWKQTSSAVIAVGLDKSNDTSDKMHYSIDGIWPDSTDIIVHGSLMMRPIFGDAAGYDPLGLEDETEFVIYPNPSNGVFYLQGIAEEILVYDLAGRMIPHTKESTEKETMITMTNASPGIYIVKAHVDGAVRTTKVMIR